MVSTTEAEVGSLYNNTHKREELCRTLKAMDHKQPPIPFMTDNTKASDIVNDMIKERRVCDIDI
eukprot:724146-Ditylum_brightwellii.AAC.1